MNNRSPEFRRIAQQGLQTIGKGVSVVEHSIEKNIHDAFLWYPSKTQEPSFWSTYKSNIKVFGAAFGLQFLNDLSFISNPSFSRYGIYLGLWYALSAAQLAPIATGIAKGIKRNFVDDFPWRRRN